MARLLQPGRLSLLFLGSPVAMVVVRPDLSFAERPAVPLLTDAAQLPVLGSTERRTLSAQVGALFTSGLAQAAGLQVRVALLWNGAAVGELRFDRASGILLAEPLGKGAPGQDGPDRGRGGPAGGGPPEKGSPGTSGK